MRAVLLFVLAAVVSPILAASDFDARKLVVVRETQADDQSLRTKLSRAGSLAEAQALAEEEGFEMVEAENGIFVVLKLESAAKWEALRQILPPSLDGEGTALKDLEPAARDWVVQSFDRANAGQALGDETRFGASWRVSIALEHDGKRVELPWSQGGLREVQASLVEAPLLAGAGPISIDARHDGSNVSIQTAPNLAPADRLEPMEVAMRVYLERLSALAEEQGNQLDRLLPAPMADLPVMPGHNTLASELPAEMQQRIRAAMATNYPFYGFDSGSAAAEFLAKARFVGMPAELSVLVAQPPRAGFPPHLLGVVVYQRD